jgi:Ni/Co efflux regulator RcnB
MKRITLVAATALMLVGPLAATANAQNYRNTDDNAARLERERAARAQNYNAREHRTVDNNDRRGDRGDNARRDNDRNDRGDRSDNNRRDNDRGNRWDGNDRRDGRGDHRNTRWDNQRHNGYTHNGRWYYGAPPAGYESRHGYQAGYRNWRRGDRLPAYYQQRYRSVDYRRERLRAPPRGYRYVEDDRGDMLLVGIATGVILSIILSQ